MKQLKPFTLAASRITLLIVVIMIAPTATRASGPTFDKAVFHHPLDITNPYMPLQPGTTFIYQGTTGRQPAHESFVVTDETKPIQGVATRVIRDTDFQAGQVVEITDDWFAQDDAGNVWYFGESSFQLNNGKVIGHEGSWQAGVNGAEAGIVMEAHPQVGDTYRQEYAPGMAEDQATILSLMESVCVPYGCFSNVLETKDFSPLEPGVVEHKYFASGVGQIKSVMVEGGSEKSHLVKIITDD